MRTPGSWLKQIDKLRKLHSKNAKEQNWKANDSVREKIKNSWDGYHASLLKESPPPHPKIVPSRADLLERINGYLSSGGLFNPEHMEHNKVRDLLIDVRDFL